MTAWPALNVEKRAASTLTPYANNARTHSEAQVAQIVASIREWGWTQPILVDDKGEVIAGHGRLMAAQAMGLDEVPVAVARGWSKAQKRAYVLADNQLALNAGWDENLLNVEFAALEAEGFDLSLTGFDLSDGGGADDEPEKQGGAGSLSERFGIPPFSVMNAREGWWQDRKRAWLALGIQSELGRGAAPGGAPMPLDRANATPGGSAMPAADYSKRQRGNGRGQPIG